MAPRHAARSAAASWSCRTCGYWHASEHRQCNWCVKEQRRSPAASQSVNALPSPRTSPSTWAGWQAPRGRQVQAKSRPPPPQSQRTSTRNSWVSFDDEEDEEACADAATPAVPAPAAAVEAAFEGPTPAEDRARRRELAQAAKTAILGVSAGDKYDEAAACLIDKLDTEIRQIDHDSHAATSSRRLSCGPAEQRSSGTRPRRPSSPRPRTMRQPRPSIFRPRNGRGRRAAFMTTLRQITRRSHLASRPTRRNTLQEVASPSRRRSTSTPMRGRPMS